MNTETELLLCAAARLYSIGIEVDAARERVRNMAVSGVSPNSRRFRQAMREFRELDAQWKMLEAQYLAERNKMLSE